jgi:hypothetical protein
LGFSEGSWLSLARIHLANYDSHDAAPANWTRACTGPQLLYLEFCENLVYGTTFDSCLRSLVKKSTDVRCLKKQAGISETLAEIKALVDADVAEAEAADEDEEAPASAHSQAQIQIIIKNAKDSNTHNTSAVALGSLSEDQKAGFDRVHARLQKQVAAMVRFIPRGLGDTPDLANAIKCTDVGAYDPCAHDGRTVAVVFDSKLAGEASSKALQRLPPFQQDECRRLLEAVRGRHGAEDELPEGDLYLFLDGGRCIMDRMTSFCIGKTYVSKTVHIYLGPDSVTKRMERVRGVAVHNVHETMKIVTSRWPKGLRSRSRQHYSGSTATNGLGPVVLPDVSNLWHVLWPVKKWGHAS